MNTTTSLCLGELKERFSDRLLTGDRPVCGSFIQDIVASGAAACEILNDLIWPTMEWLQQLHREDRVNVGQFNLATRLNRCLTDRLTAQLAPARQWPQRSGPLRR